MADADLVFYCAKCGRRLKEPGLPPAYCPRCELVDELLAERYTTHVREPEPDNSNG